MPRLGLIAPLLALQSLPTTFIESTTVRTGFGHASVSLNVMFSCVAGVVREVASNLQDSARLTHLLDGSRVWRSQKRIYDRDRNCEKGRLDLLLAETCPSVSTTFCVCQNHFFLPMFFLN